MALRPFFRVDDDHPFTGRHMLAVVFLFFGTIIAVNLVMAFAATGTFPGLVVENSYVASQHYNALIADDRARAAEGWQSELAAPDGVLRFRLAGRDGVPLHYLTVTAVAGRPSSTREDRTIVLEADGDAYGAVAALPTGLWEVDLEAKRGDAVIYRARKRLTIVPAGAP